jgi:arsenate reductase
MKRILILSKRNSARSQMAEAILNQLTFNRNEVFSAGLKPDTVHPLATRAMKELGIDISRSTTRSVNTFYNSKFDFVITLCDETREKCPVLQGAHTKIHKSIEDPVVSRGSDEEKMERFRMVRDEIKDWLTDFVERYQLV